MGGFNSRGLFIIHSGPVEVGKTSKCITRAMLLALGKCSIRHAKGLRGLILCSVRVIFPCGPFPQRLISHSHPLS